ncbi:hypothetical protein ACA910_003124 [Epithemia clementina (nom. ined.)]
MKFSRSGRLEHDDDDSETPWMSNAMCGMTEGQARLVSRWKEITAAGADAMEERDQPEQTLSTVIVDGCVNPSLNNTSRRSPRRRDSSPRSVGSSRSQSQRDQQQGGANGRTAAEAMRALQAMAQKHEEYKGQISHLKQQLSFVLGKSRTNDRALKDEDMAKKNKDAQDLITNLKQELASVQEKSRKAEEKCTAMHEKMKVISKKHEEYVEQISTLKQQLTSAQSEKDKSKEESLDMVNNFDFIAKKNEKYREQILGLKKQLSQAQDEANSSKEATEALQKEVAALREENESFAARRKEMDEVAEEQKQFKEKESALRGELATAQAKVKKDEEKIMKLYGKIQEMKKDQYHEQERGEKQKETINSLSRQLETIHGKYKVEIDKLRFKEKERAGRYFRTLCFYSILLGFVFVLCLVIPAWMGHTLYGPDQAMYLTAMGGANIVFAGLISIKCKRQVKFKQQQPHRKSGMAEKASSAAHHSTMLATNNQSNALVPQKQRRISTDDISNALFAESNDHSFNDEN